MAEDIAPRSQTMRAEGRPVVKTTVARQNQDSYAKLGMMMSGVRKKR